MSSSTMRQAPKRFSTGPLLVAWMLLAAAAAYSQTLKTTVLADGSTVGLPPYWWVAAQRGQIEIENPRTGKHKKVRNDAADGWINQGWQYVPASKTTC